MYRAGFCTTAGWQQECCREQDWRTVVGHVQRTAVDRDRPCPGKAPETWKENLTGARSLAFRSIMARSMWSTRQRSRSICSARGQERVARWQQPWNTACLGAFPGPSCLTSTTNPRARPLYFCHPWPNPWAWIGSGTENVGDFKNAMQCTRHALQTATGDVRQHLSNTNSPSGIANVNILNF